MKTATFPKLLNYASPAVLDWFWCQSCLIQHSTVTVDNSSGWNSIFIPNFNQSDHVFLDNLNMASIVRKLVETFKIFGCSWSKSCNDTLSSDGNAQAIWISKVFQVDQLINQWNLLHCQCAPPHLHFHWVNYFFPSNIYNQFCMCIWTHRFKWRWWSASSSDSIL